MKTIKLDSASWDIAIENGGMLFIHDMKALKQFIKQKLLVWKGEFFLDVNLGLDYGSILGSKQVPSEKEIVSLIESVGYGVTVNEISIELDSQRVLKVNFSADSDFGIIQNFEFV